MYIDPTTSPLKDGKRHINYKIILWLKYINILALFLIFCDQQSQNSNIILKSKKANFRPQNNFPPIFFPLISQMLLPQTFRVTRGNDVKRENHVT